MASVRTFQILTADGTTVTLTTTVPGTLSIEFPPDIPRTGMIEVEKPENYTIPITIDKPLSMPEPTPEPGSSSRCRHMHEPPKQPKRKELKQAWKENNVKTRDYAYKENNPPATEIYHPFDSMIDYEDCMRKGSRANNPFVSSWKPDSTKSVADNLASLPPTPDGIPWGMNPQASINFPCFVLNGNPTKDTLISLLKTRPYEFAPPRVHRPRRKFPIPGKILHRLLELGWIQESEAVERWLDIDWFSLRDYRVHLEKGIAAGRIVPSRPVYNEKQRKMLGNRSNLMLGERMMIWRNKIRAVEGMRWQLECAILEEEEGIEDLEQCHDWYRRHGFGWVIEKDEAMSTVVEKSPSGQTSGTATMGPQPRVTMPSTSSKVAPTVNDTHSELSPFPSSIPAVAFPIPELDPRTPTRHGSRLIHHSSGSDVGDNEQIGVDGEAASESEGSHTSGKRKLDDDKDVASDGEDSSKKRRISSNPGPSSTPTFPILSPHTPRTALPRTIPRSSLLSPITPSNLRVVAVPDTPQGDMGLRSVHPLQEGSPTPSRKSSKVVIARPESPVPVTKSKETVKARGSKKKAGSKGKKRKTSARKK
ncbi:hypothetical protein VNI00_008742 [Paramarasmius palmivorus]|uniref:Uncharacterized protein n=1 Tax=Paramarasmius palmivorus TaxID=297713 RepID=A0AAW0CXY7_9AGAR